MRVLFEHPMAELPPHLGFADSLRHLDFSILENTDTLTVDARVRVAHADHHFGNAALGDGRRACRRAAVERARLERRVKRGSGDDVSARSRVTSGRDLRVVFSGAERVTAAEELALRAHYDAAHSRVVSRAPARELRLFGDFGLPGLPFSFFKS
jgi:hypothetical protein